MHDRVCPPRRMRFSFESRCRIVQLIAQGASPQAASAACGASRATGYRLWRRYREGGFRALADRPSTPRRQPRRLPSEAEREILHWRCELGAGPAVIASIVERPSSTVHKVLRRAGCSRLPRARRDPRVRYERERPGELLHVDTKKLARFFEILCLVPRAGHRRRARALRQRQGLPLAPLARHLRRARDRAPLHAALLALDERQGRGVDQDPPARVGVSLRLPDEHAPRPSSRRLPQVVQPTATARLARSPTPDQPCLTRLWSVHLEGRKS